MTVLFLVRHGENDFVGKRLAGRLPGVHLNEKGRQQAKAIERMLGDRVFKALYSSPLERAVETAEPLAKVLGLPIILHPALQEVDYGQWQGEKISHLRRLKKWEMMEQSPSRMRFPDGESLVEAQQRVVAGIDQIAACHKDNDEVLCFSHCDSIRLALIYHLGMELDLLHRVTVSTASINILRLVHGEPPKILGINLGQTASL
jgi:probable phosphomutase (TIGR03848 family)